MNTCSVDSTLMAEAEAEFPAPVTLVTPEEQFASKMTQLFTATPTA